MFKTKKMEIVKTCQQQFRFRLPSDRVEFALEEIGIWRIYTIVIIV